MSCPLCRRMVACLGDAESNVRLFSGNSSQKNTSIVVTGTMSDWVTLQRKFCLSLKLGSYWKVYRNVNKSQLCIMVIYALQLIWQMTRNSSKQICEYIQTKILLISVCIVLFSEHLYNYRIYLNWMCAETFIARCINDMSSIQSCQYRVVDFHIIHCTSYPIMFDLGFFLYYYSLTHFHCISSHSHPYS